MQESGRCGRTQSPRKLGSAVVVRTEKLRKQFGEFVSVDDVSFEIAPATITGLIGPNGAGKTTLFNTITGFYPPTSGTVFLDDREITHFKPHELFRLGVLRTFQIAREFASMSVRENLMMVPGGQHGEKIWNSWFSRSQIAREEARTRQRADEVMEFLEISHVADLPAGQLSGGQKKLLELGRTMMTDARIVFLDEVGAGVNRTLLRRIGDAIIRLNQEQGYTFCLIEHDMAFVERLCDPVICMAEGRILAQGTMQEIVNNEEVIQAYLGSREGTAK
ncbi:MAG: ABC transporter ATP-binding protein [Rhodobacteraceae bacterium]|nr:ABC transporter ATP-binding protein [Paracoccaceae bacterium]